MRYPDPPMTADEWEKLSGPALRTRLIRHGAEAATAGDLVRFRSSKRAAAEIARYLRTPG